MRRWRAVLFTIDTNVLVYAADAGSPFHARSRQLVEASRQGPELWYVSWNVLYEFARVVTHPKVLRRPWHFREAWGFVQALLDSPAVRLMAEGPQHADIVAAMANQLSSLSGNLVHDLHTAALMKEHGLRVIYTCDTAFEQFPDLQVIDPVKA